MATAKQILDTIEIEKLVSDDVLDELYDEYRSSNGAVSAESIAARLVSRGHLSQEKADLLLNATSDSFVQVGADSLANKATAPTATGDPFGDSDGPRSAADELGGGRRKHVKKTHKNDFDSPLLLIGGGVLALLVLGGAALAILMNLQSGDQLIDSAQSNYASGSYSQARDEFEQFVEDFTGHTRWSEARVKLAVVRLRQLVETSGDWDRALGVAQEEIPQIEDEEAFPEQRSEFASLLPRVARGLAEQAERASEGLGEDDTQRLDSLVQRAGEALTLVSNTKYVPKSLRDENDLAAIKELLARVQRRREAMVDLGETLAAIGAATTGGDAAAAYDAHARFVSRRPELRDDERLAASLAGAVEAERQTIRFVDEAAPAATTEHASPVARSLPLANPRRSGSANARGVFAAEYGGVVYAVDASDGALLWRRPVGHGLSATSPTPVGENLLLIDHRRGELVLVRSTTGGLVWRSPLESPGSGAGLSKPVVAGDRVLVASDSGKLWSVDASTGERHGYAAFAQPLRAAPAYDAQWGVVHVAGEQSSLYTLDAETLACRAVHYTGHASGATPTPPIAIGGWVVLLDNVGEQTSRVNVYATDDVGLVTNRVADHRLEGVVSTPASVKDRRLSVATESGAAYLFELLADNAGNPLALLASRSPDSGTPRRRSAVEAGGGVWIAGEGMRRTAASLSDSRLVTRDLRNPCDGDLFVGALEARGGAVLHARSEAGLPGVTFGAHDARSGELVWETALGVPPATAPVLSNQPRGVVATTVTGDTHLLGPAAIRAGASEAPASTPSRPALYGGGVTLPGGRTVYARPGASEWLLGEVGSDAPPQTARLPGVLATAPASLAGALVTPLAVGQVHVLDPTGKQLTTPFQPPVKIGQSLAWTKPATASVGGDRLALLSDGEANVYCLSVRGGGQPALVESGKRRIEEARPNTAAAIAGGKGVIGLSDGRLAVFDLPGLDGMLTISLPTTITWGPHAAGDLVLVALADNTLVAVSVRGEPAIAWQAPLGASGPVGEPLAAGDAFLVALREGMLLRLAATDGTELARLDTGQELGSGASAFGPRLVVAAADGTVLVINQP